MSEIHIAAKDLIASDRMGTEITLFHNNGATTCLDLKYLSLKIDDKKKEITFSFKNGTAAHAKRTCTISGPEDLLKNFASRWLKFHVPS